MLLKVCGLRSAEQAAAVAALGADAIGVIGVSQSPRWLAQEHRRELFEAVAAARAGCLGVLVVADPTPAELPQLGPVAGHQVLQLHGAETPERCAELREQLGPELLLWKALRIHSQADLERAEAYASVVDALLLDAWVPDQLGGTGHRIPIEWLESFRPALPWWLAGGITAERLPGALQALQASPPVGVDASSGVERAPGDKDLVQVAQLVAAVAAVRQDRPT
ncbi:phosphoribosylanthranilate isomerase [Vulcanococcus sp.]|jgi:phosphoribosylanthranilate isomerase|uniref:phosphoribosylanthranilate isomerase n=1 Tax=Vulcanococcus sp. TaxID=2856995 RepID=UPI0037D9F8A0